MSHISPFFSNQSSVLIFFLCKLHHGAASPCPSYLWMSSSQAPRSASTKPSSRAHRWPPPPASPNPCPRSPLCEGPLALYDARPPNPRWERARQGDHGAQRESERRRRGDRRAETDYWGRGTELVALRARSVVLHQQIEATGPLHTRAAAQAGRIRSWRGSRRGHCST